jgi:hypothetical protein
MAFCPRRGRTRGASNVKADRYPKRGAGRAETPLSLTLFVEYQLGELIEALFAFTPEGHVFVQESVEPRTVVVLLEMAELAQDYVVHAVSRGPH